MIFSIIVWRWLNTATTIESHYEKGELKLEPLPTDRRREKISAFLEKYQSPFMDYGGVIVDISDIYGVDPFLVVAIAGHESTLGKYCTGWHGWGI